ncbi:hypothetical protein BEWA_020880 [Theileria equi strain WA]|uniref:Uncharacterized protein n=1 Tax=Theileria equi strain WA TaxID=1537102 RepID=L0AW33_THEEQ|nr:hypothetical protein BEWA_020880 [Theileria equi strain WA]AFZ79241.1 hypothetical protein BEWA_020880 [Theileria equi strain WA]|eukprot:XP_004828907.1 hypothetical protein BEWA_020880 [Theileria equi strain WA]
MSTTIDIQNKCPLGGGSTCQENSQIRARKDVVKDATDYEYCTHYFLFGQWIGQLNYGEKPLKIWDVKIQYTPFNSRYTRSEVVTVYYRKDSNRNRIKVPLILGIKESKSDGYRWYENLGKGNTIWKEINDTSGFPKSDTDPANSQFKDKLDELACKLQNIVEINLSKDKDEEYCHSHDNDGVYTKKIKVRLNPDTFDFPNYVTFDHTPNTSDTGNNELTIGGFNIGGTPQTGFSVLNFPITATKITVFVPACDHSKPFLFHINSNDQNNKWFKNTGGDTWVDVTSNSNFNKKTPDQANEHLKTNFKTLTGNLSIQQCNAPSEVKLDIKRIPSSGRDETVYFDGKNPILVKKVDGNSIPNVFLKYSHKPVTDNSKTFTVSKDLQNKGVIGTSVHKKVKDFFVYFWESETSRPILVGITKGSDQPKYYSRRNNSNENWMNTNVVGMSEREALDDQNCNRNGAIPFEISKPEDPSQFVSKAKSSACINTTRTITGPTTNFLFVDNKYNIKEYTVHNHDNSFPGSFIGTQISRVTFGGEDTTGIKLPQGYTVSKIRVYSHEPTSAPLMLQFIKKDRIEESTWFESKDSNGLTWAKLGNRSSGFYGPDGMPTEKLTTGLDDVRCLCNNEVVMDLTKSYSEALTNYCCNSHKGTGQENITVTFQPISFITSSIPCYKHDINNGITLIGMKYYEDRDHSQRKMVVLNTKEFPIQGSLSVYTFYCMTQKPVLIYVNSPGHSSVTGWYQESTTSDNSQWNKLSNELPDEIPDNFKECDKKTKLVQLLGVLGCPNSWHCSQSSGGTTTVQVTHRTTLSSSLQGSPGDGPASKGSRSSELGSDCKGEYGVCHSPPDEQEEEGPTAGYSPEKKDEKSDKSTEEKKPEEVSAPSGAGKGAIPPGQEGSPAVPKPPQAPVSGPRGGTYKGTISSSSSHDWNSGFKKLSRKIRVRVAPLFPTSVKPIASEGTKHTQQPEASAVKPVDSDKSAPPDDQTNGEGNTAARSVPDSGTSPGSNSSDPDGWVKTTLSVLTGTLAGAGSLTGFGWWIYKRYKGDPWVRHGYSIDRLKNVPY